MADKAPQLPSYLRPIIASLKKWLIEQLDLRGIGTRFISGSVIRGDIPVESVPAHASTHQNTGSDEISVAGLSGLLADAQTPLAHAASHQNAGSDEISVAGLSGLLADQQTPVNHDHSGDAGDGGTFDAANLTSGAAADGTVLTADGAGGAAWESVAGTGDMLYATIQAAQLVNEIKGWPPIVNTGDLDALLLWFRKLGTPTTAPSVQDVAAAGLTENYELCLKLVADAASEGLKQTWTFADEPRIKSGRKLSTLWAIWCVGGVGVTLSLVNSDASSTAAAQVTAAAWTIVEVPDHTLAGTSCDVQLITDGAGTFYAVPLGANIGSRGLPLAPRGLRWVDIYPSPSVSGVDPAGGTWTDVDLTTVTSPLTPLAQLSVDYYNGTALGRGILLRRKGETVGYIYAVDSQSTAQAWAGRVKLLMSLNDEQVFQYDSNAPAGDSETLYITVAGYWEFV